MLNCLKTSQISAESDFFFFFSNDEYKYTRGHFNAIYSLTGAPKMRHWISVFSGFVREWSWMCSCRKLNELYKTVAWLQMGFFFLFFFFFIPLVWVDIQCGPPDLKTVFPFIKLDDDFNRLNWGDNQTCFIQHNSAQIVLSNFLSGKRPGIICRLWQGSGTRDTSFVWRCEKSRRETFSARGGVGFSHCGLCLTPHLNNPPVAK